MFACIALNNATAYFALQILRNFTTHHLLKHFVYQLRVIRVRCVLRLVGDGCILVGVIDSWPARNRGRTE